MSYEIKQASRTSIRPLIVAYSESGCGKTYSSLLLARGMAGPKGKVVLADSESGRGSLYSDIPEIGGYLTFDLQAPFTPARYVEAIDAIEASGADVGIIDSGSHEWEGACGVLDMAVDIEHKSGRPGLHCWRAPKFEHALFVQRLLRTKVPLIVCLRAKYKSRQKKDEKGKTVIIKDDSASPIQSEEFIFEATCHFELLPDHTIIVTKEGHRGLRACLPANRSEPIGIKHGEALARWCAAPGVAPAASAPQASEPVKTSADPLKAAKSKLWALYKPFCKSVGEAETQLRTWNIITAEQTLAGLTLPQIEKAIEQTEIQLKGE